MQYAYRLVSVNRAADNLETEANKLGKDGWRLVEIFHVPSGGDSHLIFEKADEPSKPQPISEG